MTFSSSLKRLLALFLSSRPFLALAHTGLPLVGYLLSARSGLLDVKRLILFLLMTFVLSLHVLLVNNAADGDTERYVRRFNFPVLPRSSLLFSSLLLLLVAVVLAMTFGTALFVGALLVSGLWSLYSLKPVRWKGRPILSNGVHFAAGILHFMLGVIAFGKFDATVLIPGIGFGMLLTAGHLVHEILDVEQDERSADLTFARRFSREKAYFAALTFFAAATFCFLFAGYSGEMPLTCFTLAGWATILAGSIIGVGVRAMHRKAYLFQIFFRLAYSLAGIVFTWAWFRS